MKLLLIESERSIRRALCLSLQREHHQVYGAESLAEGYYLSRIEDVDLVIIDAELIKPDGKNGLAFGDKPLLVLSDDDRFSLRPVAAGGIHTLEKPFPLSLFKEAIDAMLTRDVCGLTIPCPA